MFSNLSLHETVRGTNAMHAEQSSPIVYASIIKIVVVVLLFYDHGKHLRSCRDGQA